MQETRSDPAVVECLRAIRRAGQRRLLQRAGQVFDAVYLIELTPATIERAGTIDPSTVPIHRSDPPGDGTVG